MLIELEFLRRMDDDAFAEFRRKHPNLAILAYSHQPDIASDAEFVKARTSGCLTGDCSPGELRVALSTVAAGRSYGNESLACMVRREAFRRECASQVLVESSEARVYQLLALGTALTPSPRAPDWTHALHASPALADE
jgi:DNA-binding NarL/FixJ family response regulator